MSKKTKSDDVKSFVVVFDKDSNVNLNPLTSQTVVDSQVQNALFEGLVSPHPYTLQPEPAVASRWELSKDKKVYKFFIRKNAKYSNGEKITAQDFKDTWIALLKSNSVFASMLDYIVGVKEYRLGIDKDVSKIGIKVISDNILELHLKKVYLNFLQILTHSSFVVLHKSMRDLKDFNEKTIIGNGPYSLVKKNNDVMEFRKNENYWDSKNVEVEKLKLLFSDDEKFEIKSYLKGDVNWIAKAVSGVGEGYGSDLIFSKIFGTSYLYFVTNKGVLKNKKLREALFYALPDDFKSKLSMPTNTFVPSIPNYPKPNFNVKTDLFRAKTLIEEAGYKDGKGLVLNILSTANLESFFMPYKNFWEKVFPKIKIKFKIVNTYKEFIDGQSRLDYDISMNSWVGDYLAPSAFLDLYRQNSSYNYIKFKNNKYDALLDQANETKNLKERYKLFSQAETILLNEFILIPSNNWFSYNLISLNKIGGWYSNLLDFHPFKYIKFKKQKLPIYIVDNEEK